MKRFLKWTIWLYLILLIFEGSLRKWVFPGAQEALLIIRDPLLLLSYALAVGCGIVPRNKFMIALVGLIGASLVFSFLAGQTNLLVTAYGLRTNYLHIPLIWVMAEALDRDDVEKLGSFTLLMALPMTLLMIVQFRSPMDAYINRGVGGDEVGQIYGAAGRIRPPGFFSFITGPMVFFPLAAAFFLHQATVGRRLLWPIVVACGLAIFIALPVSISRGTMITTGIVGVTYVVCMMRLGLINGSIVRFAFTGVALLVALSFLPVFREAQTVFMSRWDTAAAESDGNAWGTLISRVTSGFTEPFDYAAQAPFFGHGIGVGSNVGSRLLSGRVGFLLAENEWGKTFLELGPILGGAFIAFRTILTAYLLAIALRALLSNRDPLPMGLWAACAPAVLLHQWAPPTFLGFAVFGAGLLMASVNYVEDDDELEDEDDDELDDEDDDDEESSTEDTDDTESDEAGAPLSPIERQRRRLRGL
jgi:hypothetical protein